MDVLQRERAPSTIGYSNKLICITDIPQKNMICSRKHAYLRCSVGLRTQRECKTAKVGEDAAVCLCLTHRCSHTRQRKGYLHFGGFIPLSRVLADLRIPLMWKDTEYFKNKGGEVLLLPS